MAQKRMLNKSISISDKVNCLSDKAKILYTWGIAHTDDFGLIYYSPLKLKNLVVPFWNENEQEMLKIVNEILKNKLWLMVEFEKNKYYQYSKFNNHQEFRKDIKPILLGGAKNEWENANLIEMRTDADGCGRMRTDAFSQKVVRSAEKSPCIKLREVKLREVKLREELKIKNPNETTSKYNYEDEDMNIAKYLLELIRINNPNHKEPNLRLWADDIRKMRKIDGREENDINLIIKWAQKDDFWNANILSAGKLREKFDQLVAQAKRDINNNMIIKV